MKMGIDLETLDYFSTIIPTIIILGYLTSKLPKLRERGGILSDMGYFVIITILGLMTSYFSAHSNTALLFGPYLEMFRVLCVIIIFIITATLLDSFKEIMMGKYTRKNLLVCFILFLILSLYASKFHIDVNGAPANVRCLVVMISGLFGGPFVGIPVGIISGAYRYSLGGATALPCAISTVLSGLIGSLIFIWNNKKFPKPAPAILLMFLFTGFEMLLVVVLTPPDISFPYLYNIYPLMLFASVMGMILISITVRDEKEKLTSSSDDEENEDELEGNDEIEEMKAEIEELKNEIKRMKEE